MRSQTEGVAGRPGGTELDGGLAEAVGQLGRRGEPSSRRDLEHRFDPPVFGVTSAHATSYPDGWIIRQEIVLGTYSRSTSDDHCPVRAQTA